jgi:prepilin-type N-terminal cleavage/methylation domain-containing protein/prepilin-type processing-associated H-X9-DG protein
MKRAFTLIELLVVIAIIAILAAILFPVFAQAKVAAKRAASISNLKQHSLGIIMYAGDFDDYFPRHQYRNIGSFLPNGLPDDVYWPYAVQPYTKNWPLFRDPNQIVDFAGIWAGNYPGFKWYYNWMRWPDYGFNATYLNRAPDCNVFVAWLTHGGYGPPVSTTTPGNPADTVMLTTTKIVHSNTAGSAYTSQATDSPSAIWTPDACTWGNGGWGTGSWGDLTGTWTYPGNPTYTGPNAINYGNGGNVAFTDTHVKHLKGGGMAAGTNWRVPIANGAIQTTDLSIFAWDLN